MKHVSKIQKEFNMIKISADALCDSAGKTLTLLSDRRTTFASSAGAAPGTDVSSGGTHWNKFSLVTWSREKDCEWLLSERKVSS